MDIRRNLSTRIVVSSLILLILLATFVTAASAADRLQIKDKLQDKAQDRLRDGSCIVSQASSSVLLATDLTDTEKTSLVYMREEEKLARDVYLYLYDKWNVPIFNNIATSEQKHMDAMKYLLTQYGIQDPAATTSVGEFTDPELQELYNQLIQQGSVSLEDAFKVGVIIEEKDIADLNADIANTTHSDIKTVYGNLLRGSNNHLSAFNTHLGK